MPGPYGRKLGSAARPLLFSSSGRRVLRYLACKTTITRNGQKFADVIVTDCKINSGLKLEEMRKRP
jgi:hypothetical protein